MKRVWINGRFVLAKEVEELGMKADEVNLTVDDLKAVTAEDTWVRVWRTFAQAFTGSLVASLPTITIGSDLSLLVSAVTSVGVSAVLAGVTAVVALVQNKLEDRGVIRSTK